MDSWLKHKIELSRCYQETAFDTVNELVFTKRDGKVVTLIDGRQLVEFLSCSYLGLDMDHRVLSACSDKLSCSGFTFPAARTRILSEKFLILEDKLNKIFCNGHSVIFSSVHLVHLGVLPLLGSGEMPSYPILPGGAYFILDKSVHSSIQINRALLSQFGEVALINVNNQCELEAAFKCASKQVKTPIIIADSVGSMGGVAPINTLLDLCESYHGYAYLDDAHGTSVYGERGCGYVLEQTSYKFHPRLILVASLAKAFGSVAGVVIFPNKSDASFTKHFGPTYIFGGPPALPVINAAIAASDIHLSEELQKLQNALWDKVVYFDKLLKDSKLKIINLGKKTPIRGLLVGDEFNAIKIAKELQKKGYAITAAMYPVVGKKQAMLRMAISSSHEYSQIYGLCRCCIALSEEVLYD